MPSKSSRIPRLKRRKVRVSVPRTSPQNKSKSKSKSKSLGSKNTQKMQTVVSSFDKEFKNANLKISKLIKNKEISLADFRNYINEVNEFKGYLKLINEKL